MKLAEVSVESKNVEKRMVDKLKVEKLKVEKLKVEKLKVFKNIFLKLLFSFLGSFSIVSAQFSIVSMPFLSTPRSFRQYF